MPLLPDGQQPPSRAHPRSRRSSGPACSRSTTSVLHHLLLERTLARGEIEPYREWLDVRPRLRWAPRWPSRRAGAPTARAVPVRAAAASPLLAQSSAACWSTASGRARRLLEEMPELRGARGADADAAAAAEPIRGARLELRRRLGHPGDGAGARLVRLPDADQAHRRGDRGARRGRSFARSTCWSSASGRARARPRERSRASTGSPIACTSPASSIAPSSTRRWPPPISASTCATPPPARPRRRCCACSRRAGRRWSRTTRSSPTCRAIAWRRCRSATARSRRSPPTAASAARRSRRARRRSAAAPASTSVASTTPARAAAAHRRGLRRAGAPRRRARRTRPRRRRRRR